MGIMVADRPIREIGEKTYFNNTGCILLIFVLRSAGRNSWRSTVRTRTVLCYMCSIHEPANCELFAIKCVIFTALEVRYN